MAAEFQLMSARAHRVWALRTGLAIPQPADGGAAAWRLIGNNHRELARSPLMYAGGSALEVARHLVQQSDHLAIRLAPVGGGTWHWRAEIGIDTVALSPRTFMRRRDCQRCGARFVTLLQAGEITFDTDERRAVTR